MNFAENSRISHRQLYRQMILALLAPFLLSLFGQGRTSGLNGILGTAAAVIILLFYVIFLIRLTPCYGDLRKTAGSTVGRLIGVFYLVYVLLAGAYVLSLIEEIVPVSLLTGVSGTWISLAAVLVCSMGTHRGMQRRGRMAEVSGGLLLWGILIMMVICIGQSKVSYLQEMMATSGVTGKGFAESVYGVLCAFSAVGLMPFVLNDVEKHGSAGKSAAFGILTLGGILLGMEILFPAVFGFGRLKTEKYPIIPLLAGADLPGNVLARFDVLWMGFLLYSLLFALGSLLHYGHLIVHKAHLGTGRLWMAAVMYFLSVSRFQGMGIGALFEKYLGYVFLPGLLAVQIFLFWKGRGKWKKRSAAAVSAMLTMCLLLSGCSAAVEPEKRMYPLALGVDASGDGFEFIYGMPDLAAATGQGKGGENENSPVLAITGYDFREIEAAYNRSQEKLLDMGHLEVLILGKSILNDDRWKLFLEYLEEKPFVGEDVYVFQAENAGEVLNWRGEQNSSVGEYLKGLMENRMNGQKIKKVTLRDVLHWKYENGELTALPTVRVNGKNLQVYWE